MVDPFKVSAEVLEDDPFEDDVPDTPSSSARRKQSSKGNVPPVETAEELPVVPPRSPKWEREWRDMAGNRIALAKWYVADQESNKWSFEYEGFFRDNIGWDTLPEKIRSAVEVAFGEPAYDGTNRVNSNSRLGRMIKVGEEGVELVRTEFIYDFLPRFSPKKSMFRVTVEVVGDNADQDE